MVNIKINGKEYQVKEGTTILDAAHENGIEIPSLCFLRDLNEIGSCRICVVDIEGMKNPVISCTTKVAEGMVINTESERIDESRRKTLDLINSVHNRDCPNCDRNLNCELQKLFIKYRVYESEYKGEIPPRSIDKSTEYLIRDSSKCILCNRCVETCSQIQDVAVIGRNNRGIETEIACAFNKDMSDVPCIACGQCIISCPTGALRDKDNTRIVRNAIENKNLHVVVAPAPSVRFSLGEPFGMPIGTNVKGKMVTTLRQLGFENVFDINFGADLTVMEEAYEFVERLGSDGVFPMITSCCPAWVKYMETYYNDLIPNVSTCKSPQQMFGATIKTYYAKKNNIDPKNIFIITVMPCIAKKFEIRRQDQNASGYPDIDAVITVRELAKMIKENNIDFKNLEDGEFDNPFGVGASVIFGASGGVMESALRTAKENLEQKELENINFCEVRGSEGIKEATYNIKGEEIHVAAVSGIANAKKLLDEIREGKSKYHFIEVMACPGGCINGGGQPIIPAQTTNYINVKKERTKSIYEEDEKLEFRKAHANPYIIEVYKEFYGKPGSDLAHEYMHTSFVKRNKYIFKNKDS